MNSINSNLEDALQQLQSEASETCVRHGHVMEVWEVPDVSEMTATVAVCECRDCGKTAIITITSPSGTLDAHGLAMVTNCPGDHQKFQR